jgi:fructuronate reductase
MSLHVVGALASMETGPAAALDALTAPAIKLVTLTITEKGYEAAVDPPTPSEPPTSAPALIALSLAQRRRAGLAPPVFASLDNLLENGSMLRTRVLEAAGTIDPSLAPWIAHNVLFPSSVVDRMVPAPTEQDLEDIADRLGLIDRAAVGAEQHRSWIIQSVDGLAPLADVGVELVEDVAPFERRKLWLLNGPHSATAYGGLLAGHDTIAAAVTDPVLARFVQGLVDDTLEVAEFPAGLQAANFAEGALRRFANPALGHTCTQVGADGSTKLPQRLLPVVAARKERSLDTKGFAVVAAIWIAGALRAASRRNALHQLSRLALGSLAGNAFTAEVASVLQRLTTEGPALLEEER